MTATRTDEVRTDAEVLYMALELSGAKWRVAFASPANPRTPQWSLEAGDLAGLLRVLERARSKAGRVFGGGGAQRLRGWARRVLAASLAPGAGYRQPGHRRR